METVTVWLGGDRVAVDRDVFTNLFDASVAASRAAYLKALETSRITFDDLVELARAAQIPYTLFFAPKAVVERQVETKTKALLAGMSKGAFSINSRSHVRLSDVELIVKDLLRKQALLKRLDDTLVDNPVVGCLKRSKADVASDATALRRVLGFRVEDVKASKTKAAALDLLISRFEERQILVSRSQQGYMPQRLPRGVRFSGLCVRDKKIPYIFLTSGDSDDNPEPDGRRLFTLVLLAVFVARGKFAPVTYSDQSAKPITVREYELAEEVLMPEVECAGFETSTLDAVRATADTYRVTPSAFVMRALRLGLIDRATARQYLAELAQEFANRAKPSPRSPRPENALRRYNGVEFSKRMVYQLDRGAITPGDFCRVVFLNKLKQENIRQFRAAL